MYSETQALTDVIFILQLQQYYDLYMYSEPQALTDVQTINNPFCNYSSIIVTILWYYVRPWACINSTMRRHVVCSSCLYHRHHQNHKATMLDLQLALAQWSVSLLQLQFQISIGSNWIWEETKFHPPLTPQEIIASSFASSKCINTTSTIELVWPLRDQLKNKSMRVYNEYTESIGRVYDKYYTMSILWVLYNEYYRTCLIAQRSAEKQEYSTNIRKVYVEYTMSIRWLYNEYYTTCVTAQRLAEK